MLLYLLQPVGNVLERLLRGAVISEHDALCALVIGLSDRAKALLASGVPDLHLYIFAIHIHTLHFVVNSYYKKRLVALFT